MIEIKFTWNWI